MNCTAPRHVPSLLARAATATALPLIAYPNGGDTWDATARRWTASDAGGAFDPVAVAGWTTAGATWLGGCCGTGPAGHRAAGDGRGRPMSLEGVAFLGMRIADPAVYLRRSRSTATRWACG